VPSGVVPSVLAADCTADVSDVDLAAILEYNSLNDLGFETRSAKKKLELVIVREL